MNVDRVGKADYPIIYGIRKTEESERSFADEIEKAMRKNKYCSLCGSMIKEDGSCPLCGVPVFISGNGRALNQIISQETGSVSGVRK